MAVHWLLVPTRSSPTNDVVHFEQSQLAPRTQIHRNRKLRPNPISLEEDTMASLCDVVPFCFCEHCFCYI